MNEEAQQLKEMILGVRDAYQRGENAMEFARTHFGQAGNSPAITLLAYDLHAGNYIEGARKDPDYRERWCGQLAKLIGPYLDAQSTLLEVGCGEATTLAGVVHALATRPALAMGFDISWSRCAMGRSWLREKSVSAQLFVGDLFNIPLADASIDVVYTSHSLEPNGGRETEAIAELLRIARKAVILIEPAYEFAGEEAKARMRSHGYVRGLKGAAESLGAEVVDHRLLPIYGNPLNPSGLLALKKKDKAVEPRSTYRWRCPITHTALQAHEEGYFSPASGLLYPVLKGIPLLRAEHAVVASAFAKVAPGSKAVE